MIIEETFTLKCGAEDLESFFLRSRAHATGWIGFYWGKTPAELQPPKTIAEKLTLDWLRLFKRLKSDMLPAPP